MVKKWHDMASTDLNKENEACNEAVVSLDWKTKTLKSLNIGDQSNLVMESEIKLVLFSVKELLLQMCSKKIQI